MCEAAAFMYTNGREELIMESIDVIEPIDERGFRLVSLFGEQKEIEGRLKAVNLINHRIVFEKQPY
jgi:predicted RNA-binding protein